MNAFESEMERRTGMARWWEALPLGHVYFIRCPCGGVLEAIFEADESETGSVSRAEARALARFRERYPRCPHSTAYEALKSDPDFALSFVATFVSRLQEESDLLWGPWA